MKKLIPGIPFSGSQCHNCNLAAVISLLEHRGLSPAALLFDEWDFWYGTENGQAVILPGERPVYQPANAAERLARHGITVHIEGAPDARQFWARAKALIDRGTPVPVMVDTYHIAPFYYTAEQEHTMHCVIAAGYDEAGGAVHMVDPSFVHSFAGEVPLDAFLRSVDLSCLGRGITHFWLDIPEPVARDVRPLEAVGRNLAAMAGARRRGFTTGLPGIRRFGEEIGGWSGPEVELRQRVGALHKGLMNVAFDREMHAQFIGDLVAGGEGGLAPAHEAFEVLHEQWAGLRNLVFLGAKRNPIGEVRDKARDKVARISELEERAMGLLREVRAEHVV